MAGFAIRHGGPVNNLAKIFRYRGCLQMFSCQHRPINRISCLSLLVELITLALTGSIGLSCDFLEVMKSFNCKHTIQLCMCTCWDAQVQHSIYSNVAAQVLKHAARET